MMKIALVSNDDFSMYQFRKGLIQALMARGCDVSVITPPGPFVDKLFELGVSCITVPMYRFYSPVSDLFLIARLYRIFRAHKFDLVHNMTIKPNIYGTIAAKLAGVRDVVCLVSGLGFTFSNNSGGRTGALRYLVGHLYRVAMQLSRKTWFQNPDDLDLFIKEKIITREKGIVIRGSGVNVNEYNPAAVSLSEKSSLQREFQIPAEARCVLMVSARMIWSKGIREFLEAVTALHERYPGWFFILVCPREQHSPDSVPEGYLRLYAKKLHRLIIVDSFRYDVKTFIAMSDVMVLPSFYREGIPRFLLEGLSMSKPVITTDHPGCREVVEEGKNGYKIPVRNSKELVKKLEILMSDQRLRENFGRYSRKKAECEFDEGLIANRIINDLYEMP